MNSHSLSSMFDSVTRQIKALRQTPLEKEVSDATSNDNWGVANSVLIQLARETHDFNNFTVIVKEIWEGISDKREKWRRVYKSLVLLEYCLKYGSERVCNEARSDSFRIRPLQDFKFMEEGRDKGSGIREKAKLISDLLADAELLKTERAKAVDSKDKYAGISSAHAAAPVVQSSNNNTNKLEEYRQREKAREEEKRKLAAEPVISSSGKLVVKAPAGKASDLKKSSCNDNTKQSNLIDFDAPVVIPTGSSLTNHPHQPAYPSHTTSPLGSAVNHHQPSHFAYVGPTNPPPTNPLGSAVNHQHPSHLGYVGNQPANPLGNTGFPQATYSPYFPGSGSSGVNHFPQGYQNASPSPVTNNLMNPFSQPSPPQAAARKEDLNNPFAAFNGL